MTRVSEIPGYRFRDQRLLELALTHPSAGSPDNQRLEFLGDAVLEFLVSERLYRAYPDKAEGELTRLRAQLVCEEMLSVLADEMRLGDALRVAPGEERTGGRKRPSVLCDTMEAVIAAVYLDGGLDAVRKLVDGLLPDPKELIGSARDSKSLLQERLQSIGEPAPVYKLIRQNGPPHDPLFEVAVFRGDVELARGEGRSKKQAEQAAAREALALIKRPVEY